MTTADTVKHAIDAGAVSVAGATFFDWLPDLAALLSIAWLAIRIWETKTVQGWKKRLKKK